MDDYPAQVELHKQKLEHSVAPLCSSVHLVRIAKFMKAIAEYFGYEQDVQQYADDAKQVGDAIVNHAWDEESGYFGYVVHDGNLYAAGILRTETGENYNKGVDGVTPLIAGVTTPEQTQRLLAHLTSQQELFTPVGISTVDQSAGYYYDNGYWNGVASVSVFPLEIHAGFGIWGICRENCQNSLARLEPGDGFQL